MLFTGGAALHNPLESFFAAYTEGKQGEGTKRAGVGPLLSTRFKAEREVEPTCWLKYGNITIKPYVFVY